MSSYTIMKAVENCLDNLELKYEYDSERDVFTFDAGIDCKFNKVQYYIRIREDDYVVYITCLLNAEEEYRDEIAKYLTLANYGLVAGCFEMDYRDGEIRYKYYVDCNDLDFVPDAIISRSIFIPLGMFERYGNGLAALMMGFSDAATEIAKAESKNE